MKDYEFYRNNEIIKQAEIEMKKYKHPYVGTEHLLLALLKEKDIADICKAHNLTYQNFRDELLKIVGSSSMESNFVLHTPLLKIVIRDAMDEVGNEKTVTNEILFLSLLENSDGIAVRILINMGIDLDKLYNDIKESNSSVHTNIKFGVILNDVVDLENSVVNREKEISEIIEILLRKNKNNPLLIGSAGVGKTAIVEEIARRIKKGVFNNRLKDVVIVSLEMSNLVAGTKYRGEFEEKINSIINYAQNNPNIVLFIDEIHTIIHAGGSEGAIDAANILKPYLSSGNIKIIGATTTYEYNKYIKKDKALERRFQIVHISEPNINDTINILLSNKKVYEKFYNIKISKKNVIDIVNIANEYSKCKKNPDKSFEFLDLLCSKISLNLLKDKAYIKKEDIINLAEQIYNTSINKKYDYNKLSSVLNYSFVGQSDTWKKVIDVLKRQKEKPVSMLFCGGSGVGKTKSTTIISECLNMPLIKINMSEYMNETSINKLIGVTQGYVGYDDEFVFDKVRFYPQSIILVDEVEKGCRRILNLFLNILDEGFITDARDETIDFRKCILIFTSNLKHESSVGFLKRINYNNYFSDEFVARLDDVIYFNEVNELMIKEYLYKKGYDFLFKDIIENCDYKRFGFRIIDKYIRNCNQSTKVV